MILVDTNVWSELTKPAPNACVTNWLIDHDEDLWLSVIVIAEIRRGLEMPKAHSRRDGMLTWLATLEADYATRILPFDADMAHMFGALLARRSGEATLLDVQIAAQALAHDMTLATRNVKDFAWTGVRLVNPWGG
jgi:predicted nucleic acid-binding protein